MVPAGGGAGRSARASAGRGDRTDADRIDWLGRSVRVDRQWNSRLEVPRSSLCRKTCSSDRSIPASAFVLEELGQHVGQRHEGFVLHRDGVPIDHQVFGYNWRKTRKLAGVGEIRYHDMCHVYVSMLISAGCSVKAVSSALGHANAATTLNV